MNRRNGLQGLRWHGRLLGVVGCLVVIFLAGCASGNAPSLNATSSNTGGLAGSSNDPNAPPTPPPFPAFTVGAWVANMAPQKGEADRVYVLTRLHDPAMTGPSQPPPQGSVGVTAVIDGVAQNNPTDKTGYAYFDFKANAAPTVPSVITLTANYQGKSYQTTTFYTVLPDIKGTPTPAAGTPTPHP
ncbi:MAG: hypothetical protein H0X24_23185 [Ktedonobacterales bacterium]|nr:hypothetical protein [Ktedonobacterales bacterium]